ncbi:hypothetical protein CASFOL_025773 [Castilleja foliolosa]|uniref:RING-type domain-containing protein n=1 Tax=Castilleja foliolosa TaxID=1961234 RepID=A0ABD3CT95_9LAMI
MGLGDADLLDDGDGGGCKVDAVAVSCSICLEVVSDNEDRSWAKLQCGHQFHLDCIGSAFNIKGAMQCPNCRKIEKGQWLYANGSRPLPEFSFEDWAHDEDLYDLSYSEMSYGVHWCPFTRVPSSFDEGEFSSNAYHDLLGHHPVFPDHTPVSSTSHPCPYVAYFGPIHPAPSSASSGGSVSNGSSFNNHWNVPSGPSEVVLNSSYAAFPSMDLNYNNWDHSSSAFAAATNRISDQHLIPPMSQRTTRNTSDIQRPGMHPFMLGHSSAGRAPSSLTSSVLPTYPGTVARPRDRPSSLQAYFQQSTGNNPVARAPSVISATAGRRSSSSHRGLAQVVAPITASSSDHQSSGFYLFSSNRTFQEVENPRLDLFHHPWDREHQLQDRDSVWGSFRPPPTGSDSGGVRSGISRYRHGPERMPSQNRS